MRPKSKTQTGVGTTAPIPIDWRKKDFQLALQTIVTGTATYNIEHTLDNVYTVASPNWLPNNTLQNLSVSADGNYAFPVFAIRINVTSGTGSVQLNILQQSGA